MLVLERVVYTGSIFVMAGHQLLRRTETNTSTLLAVAILGGQPSPLPDWEDPYLRLLQSLARSRNLLGNTLPFQPDQVQGRHLDRLKDLTPSLIEEFYILSEASRLSSKMEAVRMLTNIDAVEKLYFEGKRTRFKQIRKTVKKEASRRNLEG